MTESFDLSFVEHDQARRADDFRKINAIIERLAARRKRSIEVQGPFLRSKLAWKVASYQQAVLYRVVMLARGARLTWNAQNILACFLLVRALVETIAVFDDFERQLLSALDREDLTALDQLVMNRTFATRDGELVRDFPDVLAVNVLTLVDRLQARYDLPIRDNYDSLSERCHPNSTGHHQMFSTTDTNDGTVRFSELKSVATNLDTIRAPFGLIGLFERSMDILEIAIMRIAEVQHRLNPVNGES